MHRRLARALLYAGVLVAVVAASKFHASAVSVPAYDYTGSSRFAWSLAYAGLLGLTAYGIGLPELARSRKVAWLSAIAATAAGATAISVVQLLVGDALLPRFVVFGSAALLTPWYVLCAAVARDGRARAEDRDRVVVVADTREAEVLRLDLDEAPERSACILAALSPAEAATRLADVVAETGATVVVLDRSAQADDTVVAQAATLHADGVRVRTLSLFYEEWLGKLPAAELERVGLLFDIGELHRARYGRLKRLFDVVVALTGLAVLVAVAPLVALGDLAANRGPLLYRQARVGKRGVPFTILKFRTMSGGPGASGEWTTAGDARITPFGGLLRRTHLDELPQVLNVLRGDLSVVGPRPEQPHYVDELRDKLPFYDLRHLVRPGITGWAQVKYGYAGSQADALEKLQYEFFYLRRQSLALDLRVVGRTVRSIIGRRGR